jgi:hypothetical protein
MNGQIFPEPVRPSPKGSRQAFSFSPNSNVCRLCLSYASARFDLRLDKRLSK